MTGFSIPDSQHHLQSKGSLIALVLLALVVGVVAGLVGAVFRITLERADRLRDGLIVWAHGEALAGFLFIIGLSAVATLIAAWLARRFWPHARKIRRRRSSHRLRPRAWSRGTKCPDGSKHCPFCWTDVSA